MFAQIGTCGDFSPAPSFDFDFFWKVMRVGARRERRVKKKGKIKKIVDQFKPSQMLIHSIYKKTDSLVCESNSLLKP